MTRLLVVLALTALAAPFAARANDAGVGDPDEAAAAPAPVASPAPPKPLVTTADPAALSIGYLHVVIERKGDLLEVTEMMTIKSRAGTRFSSPEGLRVELPEGAIAPKTDDANGAQLKADVDDRGFLVTDPISPGGDDLSLSFDVRIAGGAARFEQKLPAEVETFQVLATWTRAPTRLRVKGAGDAKLNDLQNGLSALVAEGRGLGRTLAVTLDGIENGPEAWFRRAAFVASVALFAAGIWAFLRRRRKERGSAR